MATSWVVFDFDGTLADTFQLTVEVFKSIGPQLGLKPLAEDVDPRSISTQQFLKKIGVSFWKLPRMMRAFHQAVSERTGEIKLFDGFRNVIPELLSRGVSLGILSSNGEPNIRSVLKAHDLENSFQFVMGYPKLFGKGKAIYSLIKQRKIPADEFLYVGDESRDIEAANYARVKSVAVSWGFHNRNVLVSSKPGWLIDKPEELLGIVDRVEEGK
jgi:phosphoglycolate phosphatase